MPNDKTTETLNRDTQAVLRGEPGAEDKLRADAGAAGQSNQSTEDVISSAQAAQAMGMGDVLADAGANYDGTIGGEPGDPAPADDLDDLDD